MVLCVGVTGHRRLADPVGVAVEVDRVLDSLAPRGGGHRIRVISSLAEGADLIVASRALARPSAGLTAILPLPAADYRRDFPDSVDEFDALLSRADSVSVAEPAGPRRTDAYLAAGHDVVDASDVLIAVWDGAPAAGRGGTAEIVGYARDRGVGVRVVTAARAATTPTPGTAS
jgi:hypothetical protein